VSFMERDVTSSGLFSSSDFEELFSELCAFASLLDGGDFATNRLLLAALAQFLSRKLRIRLDANADMSVLTDLMVLTRQTSVGAFPLEEYEAHLTGLQFSFV
jgi:hypothetical protein